MSTATVTVACKIPNGLLLQLEKRETVIVPSPAGGRKEEVGRKVGEPVKINGFAIALTGNPPDHEIHGGFGLTHGVKKDFWDAWLKQNEDLDIVKNGLIFAHEKRDNAVAQARDMRTLRSNMEPLDTDGRNPDGSLRDARMLKGIKKATDKSEE